MARARGWTRWTRQSRWDRWSQALVICAFAHICGCGLLGGGETAIRRDALLTVENLTPLAVCGVAALRGRTDGRRRVELLGEEDRIPAWRAQTLRAPVGRWDVELRDCRDRVLSVRRAVNIRGTTPLRFRAVEVERRSRSRDRRIAQADRTPAEHF